jgi:hypothetical protein
MSDSSIRVKPSIDEPSNMIWPSSAFSNWLRGHLDVLEHPHQVGELGIHCDLRSVSFGGL